MLRAKAVAQIARLELCRTACCAAETCRAAAITDVLLSHLHRREHTELILAEVPQHIDVQLHAASGGGLGLSRQERCAGLCETLLCTKAVGKRHKNSV